MTTAMSTVRPEIDLPRGTSETFTEEYTNTPGTIRSAIKVPSCRPTPLIGSWADESWPLNSRQASEIITEQVLTKQCSSTLFEDDNGNVLIAPSEDTDNTHHYNQNQGSEEEDSSCPDDQETINESMMNEAMSHAQISHEEVGSLSNPDSPTHLAQSYMYDPYNISNSQVVLCRCTCEVCVVMLHQKKHEEQLQQQLSAPIHENDSISNQVTPTVEVPVAPAAVEAEGPANKSHAFPTAPFVEDDESDWDLPTYQYPQAQQPQQHAMPQQPAFHQFPTAPMGGAAPNTGNGTGFVTHTQLSSPPFMDMTTPTQSPGNMNATPSSTVSGLSHPPPTQRRVVADKPATQTREVSTFMPPPPPPRIATMVYEEEGTVKNPSGIYYHLVMRWYNKVQEAQEYFVTSDQLCPAPNKDLFTFEQWADEVSGWWYTHFEQMQKKAPRFARRR